MRDLPLSYGRKVFFPGATENLAENKHIKLILILKVILNLVLTRGKVFRLTLDLFSGSHIAVVTAEADHSLCSYITDPRQQMSELWE
jgi:hypothetical protein